MRIHGDPDPQPCLAFSKLTAVNIYFKDNFSSSSGKVSNNLGSTGSATLPNMNMDLRNLKTGFIL